MELTINIEESDVERLRWAYEGLANDDMVQERIRLNVGPLEARPTRDEVWRYLTLALTTSRQRSTPESRIWDLWAAEPCPLRLEVVRSWQPEIGSNVARTLKSWGGIRYYNRIGEYVQFNYEKLFGEGAIDTLDGLTSQLWDLRQLPPQWNDEVRLQERIICVRVLQLGLKGIGNKQCRNWLLNAHLLRYEIPLDSRVLKFLKPIAPRVPLEQDLLGSSSYYHFVEDLVQELCKRAGVLPCVADAVMFLTADAEP